MPGTPGYWMAAGLSLNGFGGAGGIGKTIAEWMTTGETELDTTGYRAWRFGAAYRAPAQVEAAGREVYQLLLPPALPARHRRVGPAEPPLAAPRQAPGSRARRSA